MAQDLRSFLESVERTGKMYRVSKEVDLDRNMATLADESDRIIRFDNVKGYKGWSVVANLMRDRDMEAIAFSAEKDKVVQTVARRYDQGPKPHRVVKTGPVKEVIWRGEEANLMRLPIAIHSELDGGRYIGSGIGIVVDPDTGLHNTTFPRVQVSDGKNCPFMIYSPHVGRIASKYAHRKQGMPMAIVIGHHPAWEVAGASSLHHPLCGELDYVGSLLNEETEFVKCETIDVDVPASAEIVIEGETLPGVVHDEGPFGNYLGTYASSTHSKAGVQKAPVFNVKCVTMRRNPIFRHLQATVWTDHQRLCMLPIEASLFTALEEMGTLIHDVYMPSWGGCSFIVLQMTPLFPGQARDALLKALSGENTTLSFMLQGAIAVNRDVNIYDARDLIWAMTIRANWTRDTMVLPGSRCSPLMPAADKLEGVPIRIGGKFLIDATHLPERNETEHWEYERVWPMGKDSVGLRDFVDNYDPEPLHHVRVQQPPASSAMPAPGVNGTAQATGSSKTSDERPPSMSATASGEYVKVATLNEIPENGGKCVKLGKIQIALFRTDGKICAINNICPHQGGGLAEGDVDDGKVMCPLHGWMFDLKTGQAMNGSDSVEVYPVKVDGNEVHVRINGRD